MMQRVSRGIPPVAIACLAGAAFAQVPERGSEAEAQARFLTGVRQVTIEGRRAGEGYFSRDGTRMIFQSEREPGNPFFQIYVMDLDTGDTRRVSPGYGKTTCGWIFPGGERVLFASTHPDPDARKKQEEEYAFRKTGQRKRYAWDYDEHFDIFTADMDGTNLVNLTHVRGYDAEGAASPDGKLIVFASNRHAYAGDLPADEAARLADDPSYFLDLYVMDADGSNVRRLTDVPGYDGGPFFSFDGRRICWRRFTPDGARAEIWTMNADGSDPKQITRLGAMSWAPFFHPSGDYLIFTTNKHGFSNFELYIVDAAGRHEPVRVTYADRFDGLPAFSPDGRRLAWTCSRTANEQGQIFFADWNDANARESLGFDRPRSDAPVTATRPELPATTAHILAKDIEAMSSAFSRSPGAGHPASLAETTQRIATVFDSIGLVAAGESSDFVRSYDVPGERAEDRDERPAEKEWSVMGRLPAERTGTSLPPVVVGAPFGFSAGAGDRTDSVAALAGLFEIAHWLADQRSSGELQLKHDVLFVAWLAQRSAARVFLDWADGDVPGSAKGRGRFVAYVEINRIGGGEDTVELRGAGSSPVWAGEIERRNVPIGAVILLEDGLRRDSFATDFYDAGVPVLSVYTLPSGPAADSTPTTLPSDFSGAEKAARLAALIIRSLATDEEAPEFTEFTKPPPAAPGAYLGTIPDYAGDVYGVLLSGVAPDGPAAKAGIRGGDILIRLNNRPIANIQDYAKILDELRVGQSVPVVVRRAAKEVELTITVGARS